MRHVLCQKIIDRNKHNFLKYEIIIIEFFNYKFNVKQMNDDDFHNVKMKFLRCQNCLINLIDEIVKFIVKIRLIIKKIFELEKKKREKNEFLFDNKQNDVIIHTT